MQFGCAESPLALLLFVYGESLGRHGFAMVLSMIALAESSNNHDDYKLILALGCY